MNSDDTLVIDVLRDILAKLEDIHGAVEGLTLRIMAVTAIGQRAEMHADELAVDLAWSHLAAAKLPEGSPPGSRADAAVAPTPVERWGS